MASKRAWLLPPLMVIAFLVMGMGDMGLSGDDTPRKPTKNFTGTVTDRSMVTVQVSHMHCEGKTSIKAYLGEMRVTVPFEKIEKVEFTPGDGGSSWGNVLLRTGETQKLRFKSLTRCYGDTDLGQVMVKVKDLKRIVFDAPPSEVEE